MALEFSYLNFDGVQIGDEVVLCASFAESMTDWSSVAGIYRREAFRPQMLGSSNFNYHAAFQIYDTDTTQYAFDELILGLQERINGRRSDLLWYQKTTDTLMRTWPDAQLIRVDPGRGEGQAGARFSESITCEWVADRPF